MNELQLIANGGVERNMQNANQDAAGNEQSFLDDITINAKHDNSYQALRHVVINGPAIGMRINKEKTQIVLSECPTDQEAMNRADKYSLLLELTPQQKAKNIKLHPNNCRILYDKMVANAAENEMLPSFEEFKNSYLEAFGVSVLGAPLGSDYFTLKWLEVKLESLREEMNIILDFPIKQVQFNFLHYIFKPKVNHLQRTIKPELMIHFNQVFDNFKRSIFNSIVGTKVDDDTWRQGCLPIKQGGFGLGFVNELSDAAYVASCSMAIDHIEKYFPLSIKRDINILYNTVLNDDNWIHDLQHSINRVAAQQTAGNGVNLTDIQSAVDLRDEEKKLQSALASGYTEQMISQQESYVQTLLPWHSARMLSVRGPNSGAFLRAVPKKGVTELSCAEFETSCQFRLGLPLPFIPDTLRCMDCSDHPLIGIYGEHLHCCPSGNQRIKRHNLVVKEVEALCAAAGIKTDHEPLRCFPNINSNEHPDVKLIQPNHDPHCHHDKLLDVTITHPGNKTSVNRHRADRVPCAAATEREKVKRDKFEQLSKSNLMHFVPLAVESYGQYGVDMKQFMKRTVRKAWIKSGKFTTLSVYSDYWNKRVSTSIQKTNAQMLLRQSARICAGKEFERDDAYCHQNILDSRVRYVD